ncbi:alcohol dehydrogenase [Nemania diffusa]|nr:alcohol dehydrogenase [Nemania diffusa]
MASLPKTFKGAVIPKVNATVEIQEFELKPPGPGQVLVKVIVCGVCHTDLFEATGAFGDVFPRIPGHEIVGDVVSVGEKVTKFSEGDRVGGPWHGGHDNSCRSCSRGQFQMCDNEQINGVHFDGGYAEYVLLREEAVVRVPKEMDPAQAAPLLCAGVTTFNAMRKQHVEQGNLVAVQGLGGLGHLAVQFASKMGYRTVALSSGGAKAAFARELGAHEYIDASKDDPVAALQALGGAAMIVATAPNPKAISPLIGGLQAGGKLIVLAPVGPVEFDTTAMIVKGASVSGWPSGHALDSEEAILFAQTHGIKCLVEKFPLAEAANAMEHCHSGKVRFRGVLTM